MVRVGLLEDNARIARMSVMMLSYAGHQVTVYQHPNECLNALLAQPVKAENRAYSSTARVSESTSLPIDVLVLDLHLPDMNGVDVMHVLLAYPHMQTLPVIFCSAAPPQEVARALRAVPRATFVEKPFAFHELIGSIERAVQA